MSTAVNSKGVTHAKSLVSSGKVDKGTWSLSSAEENAMLGPNKDDWNNYGSWHLATHPDQSAGTKAYYGYPFGKDGKVFRNAVISAKGRAAQQGATGVEAAASAILDMIDAKKEADTMQQKDLPDRSYATMEIKSFNEEERTFEGIASTPRVDRMDDIVEPLGAIFQLPLPMLWQHGKGVIKDPVGWITSAKPNSTGIPIKGKMAKPKDDYPIPLRDALNGAWVMVRDGLVRALSIGFNPVEYEQIKDSYGMRYKKWEMLEVSPVAIPANVDGSIQSIKSYDAEQVRAALGAKHAVGVVRLSGSTPGASGQGSKSSNQHGATAMAKKSIAEQIAAFEAKRAALVAANEAVMEKASDEDRTLEKDEQDAYDDTAKEIKAVDEHLDRLKQHEKSMLETATAVSAAAGSTEASGSQVRGQSGGNGVVYGMKSRLEPGVRFARYAMAIGASKGNIMQAEMISRRWTDTPEVNQALKAAVAAGTTQDATWASPLVQLQEMQSEFIEFLRPLTLLGRLPGLRRVPFNIKFTRQTAGTNGSFVGEGLPKPLAKMDFELLSLTWAKAATIIVLTEELLRFSNPSAEVLARDDLGKGISQFLDKRFIDPVYAGVANVSPASITNGIAPIASLGTSIANITDTAALALDAMIAADLDPTNFVWVMNPTIALDLSLKRTTQDIFAFPGINALGGTFLGYPVVTSNNVVLSGSPTESFVVLCDPTNIMVADDGGVSIDMSMEASLQMDNAPSNPATSTVNLWQSNLVGLRAERFINWRLRRTTAVQVITMNVKW